MSYQDRKNIRDKVLGEGVSPAIREAFKDLFDNCCPLTSTTTT